MCGLVWISVIYIMLDHDPDLPLVLYRQQTGAVSVLAEAVTRHFRNTLPQLFIFRPGDDNDRAAFRARV